MYVDIKCIQIAQKEVKWNLLLQVSYILGKVAQCEL